MSADDLISEFESTFLDDEEIAEDIVYYVGGVTAKSIKAVIYRKGYQQRRQPGDRVRIGAGSMQAAYDFAIRISRGAENGIATVTEKTDTVDAPLNYGDTSLLKFRVAAITDEDGGSVKLGLLK